MHTQKLDNAAHFSELTLAFGSGMGIIDSGSAYRDCNRQSAHDKKAPSMTLSDMKSKEALAEERGEEEL